MAKAADKSSGAARSKGSEAAEDIVLGIRITHPDRALYAEQETVKLDLARYYAEVAPHMLPFVADRPLSLVRCPQGAQKTCFFQKHGSNGFPPELRTVPIEEKSGKSADYLYVGEAAGLVAAVQMGTLEFHIWGAPIDRLETPDRLVFDLDPDEGLPFKQVKAAAVAMREHLGEMGLETVPMVTGGKGIHVIAPLRPEAPWDMAKEFAKAVATGMAAREPERYTATMSKEKRRGRIFIDWLRNERGATAISPYSTRSRRAAPVATPVSWKELEKLEAANGFHIDDIPGRLAKADPWSELKGTQQSLTATMLEAAGR